MNIAGLLLVALCAVIGLYMGPLLTGKKKAILLSREGDRFSDQSHVIIQEAEATSARRGDERGMLLIASPVKGRNDVRPRTAHKPQNPATRDGRLTVAAARELAALRSSRAARLASEASAAKRRFVTFCVALGVVLTTAGLSITSVIDWLWIIVPAGFLAATLVASRMAGIKAERDDNAEKERFAELQSQVRQPRNLPAQVNTEAARILEEITTEPVESFDEQQEEDASSLAAKSDDVEEAVAEESEVEPVAEQLEVEDANGFEEEPGVVLPPASEPTEWEYQALPKPAHMLKESVTGRQVHADTDMIEVVQVAETPGRPIAASTDEEESPVTFSFDLNEVLKARRAQ